MNLRPKALTHLLVLWILCGIGNAQDKSVSLTGHAADLYKRAQKDGHFYKDAAKLSPQIVPTSDGKSFVAIWKPKTEPSRWIVSLHGTQGFATDTLALWQPSVKSHSIGLICLQWWMGDSPTSYYNPQQIYHEIDVVLQALKVQPGSVMFHGFSRGSSNSYAVAALDAGRGRHYFSLIVADSGSPQLDFPPTRAIVEGTYGTRPLNGTRWITSAGARDQNPTRDGIPGMREAASWLKQQGATVLFSIEDQKEGHGALQRSSSNMKKVLEAFVGK